MTKNIESLWCSETTNKVATIMQNLKNSGLLNFSISSLGLLHFQSGRAGSVLSRNTQQNGMFEGSFQRFLLGKLKSLLKRNETISLCFTGKKCSSIFEVFFFLESYDCF